MLFSLKKELDSSRKFWKSGLKIVFLSKNLTVVSTKGLSAGRQVGRLDNYLGKGSQDKQLTIFKYFSNFLTRNVKLANIQNVLG